MQNNTLMLNNIILEEIIKAKLVLPKNKTLLTETGYTGGEYDFATLHKNIGWTEDMGIPWTWTQSVTTLKALGAEPFACSVGGKRFLLPTDEKDIERKQFGRKTDIGYQLLLYTKEIGTLLRFYKDLTMHSTGTDTGNSQWGWTLKNGKIHIQYKTKAYKNELIYDEGYLEKQGNRIIFVDSRAPKLISNKEKEKTELAATLKYAADHNWQYGDPKAVTGYWHRALDRLQTVFDWSGIVWPPIDVINASIYMIRDRYLEAFFSIIALIPGVGDVLNIIFKGILRGIGGIAKFTVKVAKGVYKALFKKLPKLTKSLAQMVRAKTASIKPGLQALVNMKIITGAQAKTYLKTVDEQVEIIEKAAIEFEQETAGRMAREKLMSNPYVSKVLFPDFAVAVAKAEPGFWKAVGRLTTKTGKFFAGIFKALVSKGDAALIALYRKLLTKFAVEMQTNPRILAMVSVSFTDKTIIEAILKSKLASAEMQALAKQYPRYFKTSVTNKVGFLGADTVTIEAINPKYLVQIFEKLGANSKVYSEIAVEVFEKISRGATNFFWDLYRTNPFRKIMAEATNPVQRLAAVYPGKVGEILPKFGKALSGEFLGKQVDIVYNEVIKFKEIRAGQTDLSKNSLLVATLYECEVFEMMESAQEALENNPEYKMIRAVSSKEGGYKPYELPGSTDSTTFQNWSKSLPPLTRQRYRDAAAANINATKGLYAKQAYNDIVKAVAGLGTNIRGVNKAIELISNEKDFRIFLNQFTDGRTGYSSFNGMINGEYGIANYGDFMKLAKTLRNKLPGWTIKFNPEKGYGNRFKGDFEIYKL